jgi:AcrR family transcriptional regulator
MRTRNADKEQLVKQQAIEMLVRDGLEGFSVNKLAKACGISVATLYIYYKDKDDLIVQIALEEAKHMSAVILKNFDPESSFEEGLRQQWKNRSKYMLDNPTAALLFEQLRSSSYSERVFKNTTAEFKESMGKFMKNAVDRGEIDLLPIEVYWSVAFAPLYNLIRFHSEGRNMGGKPFMLNNKILWQTFDLVLKGLKK